MSDIIICGIDLGTSCCKVCYYDLQLAQFKNFEFNGSYFLPSIVSFEPDKIVVGVATKGVIVKESKRIIATKYDPNNRTLANLGYDVVPDEKGYCTIPITFKGRQMTVSPTHVAAILLSYIKKQLFARFGSMKKVRAVVTVPAQFRDEQKDATVNAIKMADIDLIEIINEPVAAAYSYQFDPQRRVVLRPGPHLVFDLGHGTIDVTVNKKFGEGPNGRIEVLYPAGDNECGCFDIDVAMTLFCLLQMDAGDQELFVGADRVEMLEELTLQELCKRQKELFAGKTQKAKKNMLKLREICEQQKKMFSRQDTIEIDVHSRVNEYTGDSITINRDDMKEICEEVLQRCKNKIDEAVEGSNVDDDAFSHVLLAGGGSHLPMVKEMIREEFGDVEMLSQDVDLAVSIGAGIYGQMKNDGIESFIGEVIIHDIQLKDHTGKLHTVLAKGTSITTVHSFWFESIHSDAYFDIFENGNQLGHFVVAPTQAGTFYECTVKFDENKRFILQANVGSHEIHGVNVQRHEIKDEVLEEQKRFIESFF